MKRRYIFAFGSVALLALMLWLWRSLPTMPSKEKPAPMEAASRNPQGPSGASDLPQPLFETKPSDEVLEQKTEEGHRAQISQIKEFASAFETPINFWGKVVDENGIPISAATVKLGTADRPFETGKSYERTTDAQGLFSVLGAKGLSISFDASKEAAQFLFCKS
jgi:hypothetical protein